jgi:hypothetical protein
MQSAGDEARANLAMHERNRIFSTDRCFRCGKAEDVFLGFHRLSKQQRWWDFSCRECTFRILESEGFESYNSKRKSSFHARKLQNQAEGKSMIPKEKTEGGNSNAFKANDLKKACSVKVETVDEVETQFGSRYLLTFTPAVNGFKAVWLNTTSLRRLCDKLGRNERKWKGKNVKLSPEKIMGKKAIVVSPA